MTQQEHVARDAEASLPARLCTIDDALAWVAHLRASAEADQKPALQRLASTAGGSTGWVDMVRELSVEPSFGAAGASVVELLKRMEQCGQGREQAKQQVAKLLDACPSWEAWTRWADVPDRDELRLRLEVLARCATWSERLVEFVTFFFRASVSDLYQEAAIALGRHLHHSPGLRRYLSEYAASRSVPLDQPIRLNGRRATRRLLIAISAARGTAVPELRLIRQPLPILADGDGGADVPPLPESRADLYALLLAADLAMTYAEPESAVGSAVDRLMASVAHRDPARLTRTVVSVFGRLLVRRGADETTDAWWQTIFQGQRQMLRWSGPIGFARRVTALRRADELLHTVTLMPTACAQRLVHWLLETGDDNERRFIRLRLLTWAAREHRITPPWCEMLRGDASREQIHDAADAHVDASVVLDWHERATPHAGVHRGSGMVSGPDAISQSMRFLHRLLSTMSTQHVWLSLDEATRALISMLIVDQTQHIQAPAEQVAMVMARHGFRARGTEAQRQSDGTRHGTPNAATTSIYLRLLAWEKPGSEDLIDTSTLHRIDDERVLLALIPPARHSPLLALLADAFEHQLRWQLRGEAAFSADAYLARISVRRPHPALYAHMQAVCADRTYIDAAGAVVPVIELIAGCAADAGREADTDDPIDLARGAPVSTDSRFARSVRRLRTRLLSLCDPATDLRIRLGHLADMLGETPGGQPPRSGTLLAVLTALNEAQEPLIRAGHPAWSEHTLASLEAALGDEVNRLRAAVHELLPDDWDRADESRQAVHEARSTIRAMREHIGDALPAVDAVLFRHGLALLDEKLRLWSDSLDHILEHWPEQRLHPDALDIAACDEVLGEIRRIDDHPILRTHLLELLWHSLRRWAREDGPEDPWAFELNLLNWGLTQMDAADSGQEQAWRDAILSTWCELLHAAMEHQEEQRVRRLIESDRYASVRPAPEAATTLEQAHRWSLDRYLLGTARRARTDVRASRGQSPPSRWATFGSFVGNFATMWIALLMGAIFMLDFGDAWAAMADPEIGDLRGITLSFLIAIVAAFIYIYFNLRQKSRLSPGERPAALMRSQLLRAAGFTGACLAFSALVVTVLWWLLSRTDEVVLGPWAIGHIVVWSGFAIFIGVFLGLLAGHAMRGSR